MANTFKRRLRGERELVRKLKESGDLAGELVEAATRSGAEVIRRAAETRAPGPHILAETSQKEPFRAVVDIGPDKAHWYYVFSELGTKPHVIRPSRHRVLRFAGDRGEQLFRPVVRHPGHPARPFLRPAMDSQKNRAVAEAGAVFKKSLERVGSGS